MTVIILGSHKSAYNTLALVVYIDLSCMIAGLIRPEVRRSHLMLLNDLRCPPVNEGKTRSR